MLCAYTYYYMYSLYLGNTKLKKEQRIRQNENLCHRKEKFSLILFLIKSMKFLAKLISFSCSNPTRYIFFYRFITSTKKSCHFWNVSPIILRILHNFHFLNSFFEIYFFRTLAVLQNDIFSFRSIPKTALCVAKGNIRYEVYIHWSCQLPPNNAFLFLLGIGVCSFDGVWECLCIIAARSSLYCFNFFKLYM